jgi:hypothetical protein
MMVHACNLILGIPVGDLNPETLPPENDVALARHPFYATRNAMDWGAYPSKLIALLGQIDLPDGDEDADALETVRLELSERVDELAVLNQRRFEHIQQRTRERIEPLREHLPEEHRFTYRGEEVTVRYPQNIEDDLPKAIHGIYALHRQLEHEHAQMEAMSQQIDMSQLPEELQQHLVRFNNFRRTVSGVLDDIGLELSFNQLYNFLRIFPERILEQRLNQQVLLGFMSVQDAQATWDARQAAA